MGKIEMAIDPLIKDPEIGWSVLKPTDEYLELKKAVDFLLDNVRVVSGGKVVTMREMMDARG